MRPAWSKSMQAKCEPAARPVLSGVGWRLTSGANGGKGCWKGNKRINCYFSGPFTLPSKCLIYFLFSRGSGSKIPLSITAHGS